MSSQTIELGKTYLTPGRTVGEGDINIFAGLVGDFTPVHVDDAFAKKSQFGERIAHGPLTMATAIGLFTLTGILGERVIGMINLNWDFPRPVMIGDTIRSRVTVTELRPTSKPGRNLGQFRFEVFNQNETIVQTGTMTVVLRAD
jgi:acyl dehydratase